MDVKHEPGASVGGSASERPARLGRVAPPPPRAGVAGPAGGSIPLSTMGHAARVGAAGAVRADHAVAARPLVGLAAPHRARPRGELRLTLREWEVVETVGGGLRNREVARSLGISERTVKTHLSRIFSKLHLRSRLTLTLWARAQPERGVPAAQRRT